jgi:hypothetical protein
MKRLASNALGKGTQERAETPIGRLEVAGRRISWSVKPQLDGGCSDAAVAGHANRSDRHGRSLSKDESNSEVPSDKPR